MSFGILDRDDIEYTRDYDLSGSSAIRTGGRAAVAVWPHSYFQLESCLECAASSGMDFHPCGNMTNILFSDHGYDGMLICLSKLRGIVIKGDLLTAYAGESLDNVINRAIAHNLAGLEELGGIPGSVGGATFCNAGAHGKEISSYFFYSDYITLDGRIRRMPAYSDAFSYRTSPFKDGETIICTAFRLTPERLTAQARQKKERFRTQRIEGGQYKYPSLGCFFRNPPLLSAGKLIDEAGFRGFEHKGAMVSPYHANFIVNSGNATSQALYELGEIVRNAIARKFNIELEYEIRFLGKFD